MKTIKILSVLALVATVFTSCYTEVVIEDEIIIDEPVVTLNQVLSDYEIWYVDINRSTGNTTVPFLQKAFTTSFRNGTIWANNNISGIGNAGNGFGIRIGHYSTYDFEVDITHDLDGTYTFTVRQVSANEIELRDIHSQASYILIGYQRHNFDYDLLFYDNIHYLLQEFITWEKVYTSDEGIPNIFDKENFLQFLPAQDLGNFKSSTDPNGTPIDIIYYDYEGIYDVDDIAGVCCRKTLTLDYNFPDNEFFELTVINDETIALYQLSTGTTYHFKGNGFIQYKTLNEGKPRKKTALTKKEIKKLKSQKRAKLQTI